MDLLEEQEPFSDRKLDPFYEKKRLKKIQQKPLYPLKAGKIQEYVVMKNDNRHQNRRCREIPLNESLVANVPYSMNSKYRFETMKPAELAKKSGIGNEACVIHEQVIRDSQAKSTLKSKYYADEIGASSGCVGGLVLGNANTLGVRTAVKKSSHRKGKKGKESSSEDETQSNIGNLTVYTVSKTVAPQLESKKGHGKKTKVRHGSQRSEIELEIEEFTSSSFDDELNSECSENNDVVSDFSRDVSISELITVPVKNCFGEHTEELNEAVVSQESGSNIPLTPAIVLPRELSHCFYNEFRYKTSRWGVYEFAKEGEELSRELPDNVNFTWLSSSHKAFGISVFLKTPEPSILPIFKFLVELDTSDKINITLDGRFQLKNEVKLVRHELYSEKLEDLRELVKKLASAHDSWKLLDDMYNDANCSFNACEIPGNKRIARELNDANFEYWQACDLLSDPLKVYEDKDLVSLVQEEYKKFEQDERLGFEQINADEQSLCESCGSHAVSGLSILSCFHNVCIPCLREWLLVQLKVDVFPICCPVGDCNNPVPLEIVGTLLPVIYYQYYIRRSLKHLMTSPDSIVICCPACLNVGHFLKNVRYNSLKCSNCRISFCFHCGLSPHWPLNCSEAERWIPLFKETGEVVKLRLESKLQEKMIVRKCSLCERELVAGDLVETMSCPCSPGFLFDWKTGELKIPNCYYDQIYIKGKIYAAKDLPAELLRVYCPKYSVESKYCKHWYEARQHRQLNCLVNSTYFKKKLEKSSTLHPFVLSRFKEKEILGYHLIEYGWIWLYIHRNEDMSQWKDVSIGLERIEKLLGKLIDELGLNALPNVVANVLEKLMNDLERVLDSTISNIKG